VRVCWDVFADVKVRVPRLPRTEVKVKGSKSEQLRARLSLFKQLCGSNLNDAVYDLDVGSRNKQTNKVVTVAELHHNVTMSHYI
jgi:hypothetical protein